MDDAVSTAILTAFAALTGTVPAHNSLYLAIPAKLGRSKAVESWKPPYGVFHGLTSIPHTPANRLRNGADDRSLRINFYAKNGPDADNLVQLAIAFFDGQNLTLSDSTTIRLSRGQAFYAVKGEEGENPDDAPYRASIDFQYFRQL